MIALLLDFGDEYEVDTVELADAVMEGVPGLHRVYVLESGYAVESDTIEIKESGLQLVRGE